jgi:mRNA-degrading endonuclease toxin of MazEF toxin-antitoxin module
MLKYLTAVNSYLVGMFKLTELATVDKWQLEEYIAHLPAEYMLQVENALRDILGL